MKAHMAVCPECRAHDEAVRLGVETLRGESLLPSEEFERSLRARLALTPFTPEIGEPRVAPLGVTAMAVLLLALVFLALHRPHVVATAVAEAEPPLVARPKAHAGIPFVSFVPAK
jgi:hypothetical protein